MGILMPKPTIPITYEDLLNYIEAAINEMDLDHTDEQLHRSLPNIARRTLGKKTALHRETDKRQIFGLIVRATWREGYMTGLQEVTDVVAQAIKRNRKLDSTRNKK